MTPPKALTGSDAKALLNDSKGFLFSQTPHGLACLIITVPDFFLSEFKISKDANKSL